MRVLSLCFSILCLSLFSQLASAQIVIGAPAAQEVPIMGAPLLIILGGLLGYIAYRFRGPKLSRLKSGLLLAGATALLSLGGGIGFVQYSEATTGNFVVITLQGDNSYNILPSDLNDYRNDTGITLEVKSINLPSSNCPNNPIPSLPGVQQCAVGVLIPASERCRIDCL